MDGAPEKAKAPTQKNDGEVDAGSGLNSGFMIAQYTAAALVSENKVLSHPACVDSPSDLSEQGGPRQHGDNLRAEVPVRHRKRGSGHSNRAALRLPGAGPPHEGEAGRGTEAAYKVVRGRVSHLDRDRVLANDIEAMVDLLRDGAILRAVEEAVGPLS